MYEKYSEKVSFLTIYIKEAHPSDEWQMTSNENEGVCYVQPQNEKDRVAIANDFVKRFQYKIPVIVDGMENQADQLYAGWPERLYIINEKKTIVYKGKPGPFGFYPEHIEQWLAKNFP